ncbi:aspartic proteinase CDR1-like [Ziziphus jujuba]|uniref:Aspartic proteinase CDR1-like n=1 Tax=Ziziphus jujuba TaxID=326968 RepID=A0ABM3IHD2_ZIZJJ|nr:aspartic proteinase CDR1-like [Ziziphus jujuba]
MANSILFLSFLILLITFFLPSIGNGKPDGLTIKLIHRDSPESPLYNPNLTRAQRIEKLILQFRARVKHIRSIAHDFHGRPLFKADAVSAKIDYQQSALFMAQVGIGTFTSGSNSSFSYFLLMDTGSALIWIQCEGCKDPGHHSFYQKEPVFPDKQSTSYRKLLCKRHPLCFPQECIGNFCSYHRDYADNSSTRGYLATKTFRFDSNSSTQIKEVVPNIVFGCGFDQAIDYGDEGNIAGLMALGWSQRSLVTQSGSRSNNRFSYCLQTMNRNHSQNTYLRFGSDIPQTPGLNTTELIPSGERFAYYYVTLLDLNHV